jgi:hypothetical protein
MKIDQHPFPANMLDAEGKIKVLTSEAAEKNASVDPQHRITTDDAKGKGLLTESGSSGKPPRSGIVITHQRQQEGWRQRRERYRQQQEERRQEEWNRHKDHWRCPFFIHYWEEGIKLPTVEDCPECNGYYRINRPVRRFQSGNQGLSINEPIRRKALVYDRLGAGSGYMKGLVNALHIFQETKRNLKRWQMQEFLMKKYFTGILIYVVWRQLGPTSQCGKLSFLNGVQKV